MLNKVRQPYDLETLWRIAEREWNERPKLFRLPEIQAEYDEHVRVLSDHGIDISDRIMERLFKFDVDKRIIICRNSFPYNVAPGIKHLVVWQKSSMSEIDVKNLVGEKIKLCSAGGKVIRYAMFRNPREHNSIVGVAHWQLFVECDDKCVEKIVDVVHI